MPQMPLTIIVASQSALKRQAVYESCAQKEVFAAVSSCGVELQSGVPEQPVGLDEIFRGADNRVRAALKTIYSGYFIAIESGIISHGETVDVAAVILITPKGQTYKVLSMPFTFPREYVQMARQRGFNTTTVAQVICEQLGGEKDDPHKTLSQGHVTRIQILIPAIIDVMNLAGL